MITATISNQKLFNQKNYPYISKKLGYVSKFFILIKLRSLIINIKNLIFSQFYLPKQRKLRKKLWLFIKHIPKR